MNEMMNILGQKSSFSNQTNCVRVKRYGHLIFIRDDKDPMKIMATDVESFTAFLKGVKAGEFDHFVRDAANVDESDEDDTMAVAASLGFAQMPTFG